MTTRPPPDAVKSPLEEFDWAAPVSPTDEQAATWLVRLTSGHATDAERAAFAQWRNADPAHEQALSRLRAIWGALPGAPGRAQYQVPEPAAATFGSATPRRWRPWRGWALAASLLAAVAVAWQAQTNWRYDEVTAAGERRTIELEDGSTVLLAGGTALEITFDAATRRVQLARGEAYFDVRADAGRPFTINAGPVSVQVIGTRFSVRRDTASTEITVLEGVVRVDAGSEARVLEVGQQLRFGESGLTTPETVNVDEVLAWRAGRLIVNEATLDEIAALINRHRAGTILVRVDPSLQAPVNAVIDLDNVDAWLAALERQNRGRVVRLGPVTLIH